MLENVDKTTPRFLIIIIFIFRITKASYYRNVNQATVKMF